MLGDVLLMAFSGVGAWCSVVGAAEGLDLVFFARTLLPCTVSPASFGGSELSVLHACLLF